MIPTTRPKLQFLSPEFVAKIVDEGCLLLEQQGVFVENDEALDLLAAAGMKIDASAARVHITRKLIDDCLATTPEVIKMYDRAGRKEYIVGGDEIHFDPGSAGVSVLDHATGAERRAVTGDLVRLYDLVETLPNLDFQSTALVSSDVPLPSRTSGDFTWVSCALPSPSSRGCSVSSPSNRCATCWSLSGEAPPSSRPSRWPSSTPAPPLPSSGAT